MTTTRSTSIIESVEKILSVLFTIPVLGAAIYIAYWLIFVAPVKTNHFVLEQTSSKGWAWFAGFIVFLIVAAIGLGSALAETEE